MNQQKIQQFEIEIEIDEHFEIRERCKGVHLWRSRRELSNAYLLAKFGFDTAKNETSKVWQPTRHALAAQPQLWTVSGTCLHS